MPCIIYRNPSTFSLSPSHSLVLLQSSLSSAMGELDPTFIQEPEHRPILAIIEAQGIPQINISPLVKLSAADYNAASIQDLVSEVREACKNWGFFHVFNRGVPLESREKIFSGTGKKGALSVEACGAYVKDVQQPSYKLLELMASPLSLNLPANQFQPFFSKDQSSSIQLNHYPLCPIPDLALGVGRHKDAIALTI
ncbi:DMR6-like oxygenase 2-like protein [Tanacetum coccineum]